MPSHQIKDITYFDLDPTRGREIRKIRPCLIIGNPGVSQHSSSPSGIIVALPITSSSRNFWTEIPISQKGQMQGDSYALCHQIRALDISRAADKIAEATPIEMKRVRRVLKIMFGL